MNNEIISKQLSKQNVIYLMQHLSEPHKSTTMWKVIKILNEQNIRHKYSTTLEYVQQEISLALTKN